jgi:hypothetical protein
MIGNSLAAVTDTKADRAGGRERERESEIVCEKGSGYVDEAAKQSRRG